MRLAEEVLRLLRIKKVTYYEGQAVGYDDDGFIQLKATELLAELLGKRKNQVDVNHGLQPGSYGVLLVSGPSSRDEWEKRAKEQQSGGGDVGAGES